MSDLTHQVFNAKLVGMLAGQERGTTADLTDFAIAYWDGAEVRYLFLDEDNHGTLNEPFDLNEIQINEWHDLLAAWFADPRFTEKRLELIKRLDLTAQISR